MILQQFGILMIVYMHMLIHIYTHILTVHELDKYRYIYLCGQQECGSFLKLAGDLINSIPSLSVQTLVLDWGRVQYLSIQTCWGGHNLTLLSLSATDGGASDISKRVTAAHHRSRAGRSQSFRLLVLNCAIILNGSIVYGINIEGRMAK